MLLLIIGSAVIGGLVGKRYLGRIFEGWTDGSPHPLEEQERAFAARWGAFLISALVCAAVAYLITGFFNAR